MAVFERSTEIPCSAAALFRYHAAPGAFGRLSPPFDAGTVVVPLARLADGERAEIDVGLGPLTIRWVARHENVVDPATSADGAGGFVDVMERGPFASWRHEHIFEPLAPDASAGPGGERCRLIDRITYRGPAFGLGDGVVVERKLDAMFRHRHATTRLDAALLRALPAPRGSAGPLRVGVTGATGLIGTEVRALLSVFGCDVVAFVRPGSSSSASSSSITWNPATGEVGANASGLDAVVHLAGENVGEGRLDDDKKRRVREQRVTQTTKLLDALQALPQPPRVVVAASAVGVYGDRGDDVVDEQSPPPSGSAANFFSELCAAWEDALLAPSSAPLSSSSPPSLSPPLSPPSGKRPWRTVALRIGIVQSPRGGALAKLAPVFSMGGGGMLGDGTGWTPPLTIDDVGAIVWRALVDDRLQGVVNAVGPAPVTQRDYAKTLGHVLHRPAILRVPRAALRLALGEFGDRILDSQRVVPTRLTALGHTFRHASLEDGLRHVLGR